MIKFTKKMFEIKRAEDAQGYVIYLGGIRVCKKTFKTKKEANKWLGEYIALVNISGNRKKKEGAKK